MGTSDHSRLQMQATIRAAISSQWAMDATDITFDDPVRSVELFDRCMAVLGSSGVRSSSVATSQWKALRLLVEEVVSTSGISDIRIVHRYSVEAGVICVERWATLWQLVERWDIGSSDLGVVNVVGSSGVWFARDYYDTHGAYVRESVINVVQW